MNRFHQHQHILCPLSIGLAPCLNLVTTAGPTSWVTGLPRLCPMQESMTTHSPPQQPTLHGQNHLTLEASEVNRLLLIPAAITITRTFHTRECSNHQSLCRDDSTITRPTH